ncbi:RuvX/YqgF family protein [Thermotoga sp. KOL6]|uniref:RuvX/YqgF family protein n=1 Tax=Thermotoga sp. KOL6 TaxID=126741 RepID=UPI000C791472|nr:RuvX/YqgF family protein [Thermotoga sp. KOL6]
MIVAVDYGEKKCGVAYGQFLPRESVVVPTGRLKDFIKKLRPEKIAFGLPLSMSGRYSQQTFKTIQVAIKFSKEYETYLCDERLTTKIATKISKRDDAVSAALIFQLFVENPLSCVKVEDRREKVDITVGNAVYERVLLYEFPDPSLRIEAKEIYVVTRDPVLAYFYYEKGYFVERSIPNKKYDLVLSGKNCGELVNYTTERGKLVCL